MASSVWHVALKTTIPMSLSYYFFGEDASQARKAKPEQIKNTSSLQLGTKHHIIADKFFQN